jgi:8-oxo-dGTP pyrophosphatase MutT (NUDIX family)
MNQNYYIIPEGEAFSPSLHVSGCFLEFNSKVLYIKRAPHISQPNTWCIPGGRLEKDETPLAGVLREVFEEVGIVLTEQQVCHVGKVQIRKPDIDYVFHLYHVVLAEMPALNLCLNECTEAQWLSLQEIKQLPLTPGGKDVLARYEKFRISKY